MKNQIIFKNYSSRIIFSLLNIGLGFIVTPLLIKFLGKDDFSLYKLSYDWLSSIGFLEQALTSAVLAILANVSDSHRDHYTYYTFKKFIAFSFLFIFLAALAIPLLPYFYHIPESRLSQVQIGFFIGSLSFILLPFTVLKMWIEFHEKSYVLNWARLVQNIFQALISILFAWISFGIVGQFSSVLIAQFVFALIIWKTFKDTSRHLTSIDIGTEEKLAFKKLLLNSNKDGLILSLCSKLSFFSDSLLLGFFYSPVLILPFTLTQRLTLMIQENIQSLGNSAWASLVDLYRKNEQIEFEKKLFSLTRVVISLSLIVTLPLLFLNKSFIRLWVGEHLYAGFVVTLIACLNTYFMGVFSLWGWCLSGIGKIKIQIPIYIANAIVNLGCTLLFIKKIGIPAPILGTLAGFVLIYSVMLPRALQTHMQISSKKLIQEIFFPMILIIPAGLIAFHYQDLFDEIHFVGLIFHYALLATLFFVILFFAYLKQNERNYLINMLTSKLKRPKSQA